MSNLPATYLDFDIDAAERDLEQRKEADEDSIYIKLQRGENVLRILPPPVAWADYFAAQGRRPDPFFIVWKHFYERPDQPKKYVTYPCPMKMAGQFCPDCERAARLKASSDPVDRELAGDYEAKHKFLVNVVDRDREDLGPRIYEGSYPWKKFTGKSAYEKIQGVMSGRARANLITPSAAGYDLVIKKETDGSRNGTAYTFFADRSPRPLHESPEVALRWIAEQHDLREWIKPPTPEQMAAILNGDAMSPRELHPDGSLRNPQRAGGAGVRPAVPSGSRPALPAGARQQTARPAARPAETAQDYIDTSASPVEEELDF